MDEKLKTLAAWLRESDSIVFFGGAGVSTESGIPDFRSQDGLYRMSWAYPPETILSHSFFINHPEVFFRFHREKIIFKDAKPNRAHLRLAELEQAGKLRAVVTQNIDGLHQAAGSAAVYELHGSIHRNYCMDCGKRYPLAFVAEGADVPRCGCGGIVRPDVVLYEEALDQAVLNGAAEAIRRADLLIVGGTSLVVYPAAGLLDDYRGERLVLINQSPTPVDMRADLVIAGKIGEVFARI